jgi:serine/threonine protein kinase
MADIWACGIIAYSLLVGMHPFVIADDSTEDIKDKILKFKEIKFPSSVSALAKHLIQRLCTPE